MSHGLYKVYASTMASGGTMSSEVDLGRAFKTVYLVIPTMATASNGMYIYAADKASAASGVYRILMHPSINSSTVTTNQHIITSAATNCIVPLPTGLGLQYLKVNTNATVANGCLFQFLCSD